MDMHTYLHICSHAYRHNYKLACVGTCELPFIVVETTDLPPKLSFTQERKLHDRHLRKLNKFLHTIEKDPKACSHWSYRLVLRLLALRTWT